MMYNCFTFDDGHDTSRTLLVMTEPLCCLLAMLQRVVFVRALRCVPPSVAPRARCKWSNTFGNYAELLHALTNAHRHALMRMGSCHLAPRAYLSFPGNTIQRMTCTTPRIAPTPLGTQMKGLCMARP